MTTTLYDTLQNVLKRDERFFSNDGELLRNAVYEAAMDMDEKLLHLLLSNETTKQRLFKSVDGILVFDKVGFGWIINNRQFLPDSYTRYKNKIGLADENDNMISSTGKTELVFPYKECVLEGGQTTEEQKRDEIFYNETLAPEEIDRLLYPKVLVNVKKIEKDREESNITSIADNDNLVIKGNNLLALSSLLKRYRGRIKCIYIDPPYFFSDNKSGDSFGYNSNFKLSTWLVFMKNRLSIAKELLSKDGSIWISVGTDGQHYLKVLADSIFGMDCFVSDITWQKTYSPRNDAEGISGEGESVLVYSKMPKWSPNKLPRTEKMNSVYKNPDNDAKPWRNSDAFAPSAATHQGMVYAIQHPMTGQMIYPYKGACWPLKQGNINNGEIENATMLYEMNKWAKYELKDIHDDTDRAAVCGISIDSVRKKVCAIVLAEPLESSSKKVRDIYKRGHWPKFFFTKNGMGGIARKTYLTEVGGKNITNLWLYSEAGNTDGAKKEIISLFNDKVFATPKPERLLQRIIHTSTNEGDIVLDFHLGSGTTCAVANKMKRQYIGIDQMDYIETVAVERLKKVISGEQSGISKEVEWSGGGSFIYCELAKLNQKYVDDIAEAQNDDEFSVILNNIKKSGYLNYKVKVKDIEADSDDFKSLSLDDKKKLLMELLDKNMLYVNLCDIDDEDYAISNSDKKFNKSFYGKEA